MSEETEELESLIDNSKEEKPDPKFSETKSRQKNPNRVKAGLKLAAIGQKAKEEKMRKKVQDEMIKPSTWILMGVALSSIGFVGLYLSPLFSHVKPEPPPPSRKEEPRNTNYFGEKKFKIFYLER